MPTLRVVSIRASGGDYTTMQAAITAEAKDLVALDRELRFDCGNLQDTSANLTGFITDATRFVEVRATARHDGRWSTSAYRMVGNPGYDVGVLRVDNTQFVLVDGVQTEHTRAVGGRPQGIEIYGAGAGLVIIKDPICRYTQAGVETEVESAGVRSKVNGTGTVVVVNPNAYGYGCGVAQTAANYTAATRFFLFNPTCVNNQINQVNLFGLDASLAGAVVRLRNALMQGAGVNYVPPQGVAGDYVTSTNITEDASSPQVGLRNLVVTFVNEAGFDFRLTTSDAVARDAGTNLSADADYAFATDSIGTARPQGSAWDIGAFEVVAAGGTTYDFTLTDSVGFSDVTTAALAATTHDLTLADSLGFSESMTWEDESDLPNDTFGFSEAYAFSVQSPAVSDLVLTEAFGMSDAYTFSVTSPTPPAGELSARRGKGAVLRRRRR